MNPPSQGLIRTVAVLGAGLQGICAALALREKGYRIVLIDQDAQPMQRASLRNEGKVHLGFTFANDRSFRSARLMLASALRFAPLIDRWLPGRLDWHRLRSKPFTYLIMRDSLLDAAELCDHYQRIGECVAATDGPTNYLGHTLGWTWQPIAVPSYANPRQVTAAVATEEVALDVPAFREALCEAIRELPGIVTRYGWRVEGVQRASNGFRLDGVDPAGQASRLDVDCVVNCLWDNRLAIDQQLGLAPDRPWVHRLKYRVLAALPEALRDLPALSLVLGQYGDIVPLPGASYVSWYPTCRRGWSRELRPPEAWTGPCRGDVDAAVTQRVASETLAAFDQIVPGLSSSQAIRVDAGVVFSWGDCDIDHPHSELHQRHAVGVHAADGYFSIDTGKLTCAPYFAERLATQL